MISIEGRDPDESRPNKKLRQSIKKEENDDVEFDTDDKLTESIQKLVEFSTSHSTIDPLQLILAQEVTKQQQLKVDQLKLELQLEELKRK